MMPRNPTLRPHRAPSETIALAPPAANKCNNCRHSIQVSNGRGGRVTCLLFSQQMPTLDHCCRWQTRGES